MKRKTRIFLAEDDCALFKEALREIAADVELTRACNGEELMHLFAVILPPDVIFLDLNMPLKNDYECLAEIKQSEMLNDVPVVIFSTAKKEDIVTKIYIDERHHFVEKPYSFDKLKQIIEDTLLLSWDHSLHHY